MTAPTPVELQMDTSADQQRNRRPSAGGSARETAVMTSDGQHGCQCRHLTVKHRETCSGLRLGVEIKCPSRLGDLRDRQPVVNKSGSRNAAVGYVEADADEVLRVWNRREICDT
jgi:hypothetical protein